MKSVKKIVVITIILVALLVIAFQDIFDDNEKLLKERTYIASPAADGMVHIETNEISFDIDIYEHPNIRGALPEHNMTYEKAAAACEAEGKRLCTNKEWLEACRGEEINIYGHESRKFVWNRCNDLHGDRKLVPSGVMPGCRSAAGVFDMSGNLWEWVQPSETGVLQAKGGSYIEGEFFERCNYVLKLFSVQTPHMAFENFGARCCGNAK